MLIHPVREVRIFPLHTLANTPSPHLPPVLAALPASGYAAFIEQVPYEFQRGANQMLRVRREGYNTGNSGLQ